MQAELDRFSMVRSKSDMGTKEGAHMNPCGARSQP
jgi:hypothetical protein